MTVYLDGRRVPPTTPIPRDGVWHHLVVVA